MSTLADELAALQNRPEPPAGAAAGEPSTPAFEPAPAPEPAAAATPIAAPAPAPQPSAASAPLSDPAAALGAPGEGAPAAPPATLEEALARLAEADGRYAEADGRFKDQQGRAATERAERRQLERTLQGLQQQNQLQMQNFQTLVARMLADRAGAPGAAAPAQPDPAQALAQITPEDLHRDPMAALQKLVGYANAMVQRENEQTRSLHERKRQAEENERVVRLQVQQVQEEAHSLRDFESEFAAVTPDYQEAANHFVNTRRAQLTAMYPHFDAERITNAITHEVLQSASQARQQGQNPAALIYAAAQAFGYKRAAPPPTPTPRPAALAPPAAAAAPAAAAPANPLAQVQAGLEAAASLGAGGGGLPGGGEMTLADMLNLDGAAFMAASDKWLRTNTGRGG